MPLPAFQAVSEAFPDTSINIGTTLLEIYIHNVQAVCNYTLGALKCIFPFEIKTGIEFNMVHNENLFKVAFIEKNTSLFSDYDIISNRYSSNNLHT